MIVKKYAEIFSGGLFWKEYKGENRATGGLTRMWMASATGPESS